MEGENGLPPAPPSPASSSRWNPTKEQISLLEGLYREGVRTPTAEQIQHITGKLRKYGRIEGKNVFYWFQNHKARQRQKQKQESLGYFARFLRNRAGQPPILCPAPPPPPLLPTPPACPATNVVRTPFCMPQYAGLGIFPPFQRVALPGVAHMRLEGGQRMLVEKPVCGAPELGSDACGLLRHNVTIAPGGDEGVCMGNVTEPDETLQLFPLHPTGILQDKPGSSVCSMISSECESLDEGESGEKHLPFDFLGSGKSS